MDVLHNTQVTADQIDHLGHMNVRFYGAHARTGSDRLLGSFGLVADEGHTVVQRDSYVRHHREQLQGAPLEVRGGVLDASSHEITLYEELANTDTGDVAATFVLTFELADRRTRRPVAIDDAALGAARRTIVALPDHGRPRTIDLDEDPTRPPPALETLRARDLAIRQVRTIDASQCDVDGFVLAHSVAELVWGGDPVPGHEFRELEPLPGGSQLGFATLETRATWARFVRSGDRIQSFGAELDIQSKTMLSRNWLIDVDRGDLVAVFTVVSIAFDVGARRAIVIPDGARRRMTRRLHADLAAPVRS